MMQKSTSWKLLFTLRENTLYGLHFALESVAFDVEESVAGESKLMDRHFASVFSSFSWELFPRATLNAVREQ